MTRAISVAQLLSRKRRVMDFQGEWLSLMGQPELTGSWIVWGASGSGKTRFVLQLCKYLTRFGRVVYNSLEEGDSKSLSTAFEQVGMAEVARKIILLDAEPMAELSERLSKHKSPDIVVIDSLQYTAMSYAEYRDLRGTHRNKLFIFISH
ncbi:MAG: ATP-dependent serine protease, partial [Mucinivorans sp.]